MKRTFQFTLLLGFAIALLACGGGGGGGNQSDESAALNSGPQINSNGYIYYIYDSQVMRYDVDSKIEQRTIYHNFRTPTNVSMSDDSRLFAVVSGSETQVYDSDSNLKYQFSTNYNGDMDPPIRFSPDNKHIMFNQSIFGSDDQLWVMGLDGYGWKINGGSAGWDWLNNQEIIYVYNDESIVRQRFFNSDGSKSNESGQALVTYQGEYIWDLSVSPDGKSIAFIKNGSAVFVMNIDGGGDRQIAEGFGDGETFDGLAYIEWSPNGEYLGVGTRGIKYWAYDMRLCSSIFIIPSNPENPISFTSGDHRITVNRNDGSYYLCNFDPQFSWRAQ